MAVNLSKEVATREGQGLWDFITTVALFASAYILYFQPALGLRVVAAVLFLKAVEISYRNFVKNR